MLLLWAYLEWPTLSSSVSSLLRVLSQGMCNTSCGQVSFSSKIRLCWCVYFSNSLQIRKFFQVVGDLDSISSLAWEAASHIPHLPRENFQSVTVLESRQPPFLYNNCSAAQRGCRIHGWKWNSKHNANYLCKLLNRNLKLFYHWLFIMHSQTTYQLVSAGGTN